MTTTPHRESVGAAELVTWRLDADETGEPVAGALFGDRCAEVIVEGGGTVHLEGSNSGEVWVVLHDSFANLASLSANAIIQVMCVPRHFRPRLVGGTSATITLYSRRTLR